MVTVEELPVYFEASDVDSSGYIYAGRGTEYGDGNLHRSTDSGKTWAPIYNFPDGNAPRSFRLCFVDSNDAVYIGALERLYRSNDQGETWHPVLVFPPGSDEPWGIAEDVKGNLYVGSHGANSQIFKTGDSGESWIEVTGPWNAMHIHDIAVSSETGWIYIVLESPRQEKGIIGAIRRASRRYFGTMYGHPGVWRSKDDGKSWDYIARGTTYKVGLTVDDTTVYVGSEHSGGENYIHRFYDDGTKGPFETEIVHTIPRKYGQPVIAGRTVPTPSEYKLIYSTANASGPTGTAQLLVSKHGDDWEVIDSKDDVLPRRSFYYLSHHPRNGRYYACRYPSSVAIRL